MLLPVRGITYQKTVGLSLKQKNVIFGTTQCSVSWVPVDIVMGHSINDRLPSSVVVENWWSYTSACPACLWRLHGGPKSSCTCYNRCENICLFQSLCVISHDNFPLHKCITVVVQFVLCWVFTLSMPVGGRMD